MLISFMYSNFNIINASYLKLSSCCPENITSTLFRGADSVMVFSLVESLSPDYIYALSASSSSSRFLRNKLSSLCKEGYLKKISLSDNYSSHVYTLTKKGVKKLSSQAGGNFDYKRFDKKITTLRHDFSNGLNALSLTTLPKAVHSKLIYEYGILPGDFFLQDISSHILRPDLIVRNSYFRNEQFLFFEQDMGTERNSVLLDKIFTYAEGQVVSKYIRNVFVLSCRDSYTNPLSIKNADAFKVDYIKALIFIMDTYNFDNTVEFIDYLRNGNLTSELILSVSDSIFGNIQGLISFLDELTHVVSFMEPELYTNLIEKYGIYPSEHSLTLSELSLYANDCAKHRNYYQTYAWNKHQYDTAKNTFSRLLTVLDNELDAYKMDKDKPTQPKYYPDSKISVLRHCMYSGAQFYVCSTDLMPKYLPYMLSEVCGPYLGIISYMGKYYTELMDYSEFLISSYKQTGLYFGLVDNPSAVKFYPLSKDLIIEHKKFYKAFSIGCRASLLRLRNTFVINNKDTVSFEYISHDIGARYRAFAFYENFVAPFSGLDNIQQNIRGFSDEQVKLVQTLKNDSLIPKHHLIAVVDSYEDAAAFASRFFTSNTGMASFMKNENTFHFVLEDELSFILRSIDKDSLSYEQAYYLRKDILEQLEVYKDGPLFHYGPLPAAPDPYNVFSVTD